MVSVRQSGPRAEWHLLFNRHGTMVRLGQESAAGRSEPLHLLSRHGAGPDDEQILGQRILPARPGKRKTCRRIASHPSFKPVAMLGVHDPGEHRARQSRWQTSDVARWEIDRRIYRHSLAQRYGSQSELFLARALRLRRRRSDKAILERKPIRLVR